jgi:hypothetical protein
LLGGQQFPRELDVALLFLGWWLQLLVVLANLVFLEFLGVDAVKVVVLGGSLLLVLVDVYVNALSLVLNGLRG